MEESFSRKRPSFETFRVWFIEEVERQAQTKIDNPFMNWHDVGSEKLRENIIDTFLEMLESRFGFQPVFKTKLSQLDSSLESVIIQIFHVFSTMFLVEHINEKAYKQRENPKH
ncbi:hypothetical protein [Desulfotruncus alcoholivorax]|uniref:hypothetical protein n=1 Tax=Desulfotruncus alcoholivorax TaxID=265477 RepID=UPI000410F623|nr:hypothetical protein [Desulfotruncus alcoholivorax]